MIVILLNHDHLEHSTKPVRRDLDDSIKHDPPPLRSPPRLSPTNNFARRRSAKKE